VQGYTSPYFGVTGMKMLREGMAAAEVLESVLAEDPIRQSRQILALDSAGHTAVFTGNALPGYAGAVESDRYAVGGVGLAGDSVLSKCGKIFEATQGQLADRLLAAISSAATGQGFADAVSAVLRISKDQPYPCLDLRIDKHDQPVQALAALLAKWRENNADASV